MFISKRRLWVDIFKTFGICYLKSVNALDFQLGSLVKTSDRRNYGGSRKWHKMQNKFYTDG